MVQSRPQVEIHNDDQNWQAVLVVYSMRSVSGSNRRDREMQKERNTYKERLTGCSPK